MSPITSLPLSQAQPNRPVVFPPDQPSINITIGAVVISTWFSIFAFGVVCSAAYCYYVQFTHDQWPVRVVVGVVLFIATVDTVANLVWVYEWTVTLWGSIPGAGLLPYGFYVNILCDSTATSVTHLFYAWRLWLISGGNFLVTGLIVLAAVTQQFVAIWALSVWGRHNVLFKDLGIVLPGAYGWLIGGIVGDTVISAAMVYYLRLQTRNLPSQKSFNAIISRTVQANAFSLVSQTLTFILYKTNTGMFFFLNDVVIAKVYAFSLIMSLNLRNSSTTLFNMSRSMKFTAGASNSSHCLGQTAIGSNERREPAPRILEQGLAIPDAAPACEYSLSTSSRGTG